MLLKIRVLDAFGVQVGIGCVVVGSEFAQVSRSIQGEMAYAIPQERIRLVIPPVGDKRMAWSITIEPLEDDELKRRNHATAQEQAAGYQP